MNVRGFFCTVSRGSPRIDNWAVGAYFALGRGRLPNVSFAVICVGLLEMPLISPTFAEATFCVVIARRDMATGARVGASADKVSTCQCLRIVD
jgi:hypothetical protein